MWKHSFTTGVIAKELINRSEYKQESAQGYLIGLICNLGDMIIYQLLMESFAYVHPDCQPNSFAFKNLLIKN
ncbi:HDOD domain-containing protein [Candidatus Colwellia aromaticivorans]|uniref:HDOD domain-containing protein n=1 Tax=Candidatus Colwellia aromaticivorans TaxID=2267621 RepID=UPI000DF23609